jgi:hypothetical protein
MFGKFKNKEKKATNIIDQLDIGDHKFEIKCRARGMDPDEVKKQIRDR